MLPLCADDVVVFLERVFQLQQLTGAEGCSYPLGLPEGLQQEPWDVGTWKQTAEFSIRYLFPLLFRKLHNLWRRLLFFLINLNVREQIIMLVFANIAAYAEFIRHE